MSLKITAKPSAAYEQKLLPAWARARSALGDATQKAKVEDDVRNAADEVLFERYPALRKDS